jgi:CheY-like chemotaxis protein
MRALEKRFPLVTAQAFAVKGLAGGGSKLLTNSAVCDARMRETLANNKRWLPMSNPAMPLPQRGPTPGLPANHTPLRLMAPRVLVVEDDISVAMLIEDMVSELAYEVAAVVPRLEDAMRLLDSDTFDLAMLDVHLNGKTVFSFAAELELRDIPFLFATSYGPRGIPEEFQSHLVLQKPFGPVELRRALMELSAAPT